MRTLDVVNKEIEKHENIIKRENKRHDEIVGKHNQKLKQLFEEKDEISMHDVWLEAQKHRVYTADDLRKLLEERIKTNEMILKGGNTGDT